MVKKYLSRIIIRHKGRVYQILGDFRYSIDIVLYKVASGVRMR